MLALDLSVSLFTVVLFGAVKLIHHRVDRNVWFEGVKVRYLYIFLTRR
jgi:hypothetical protein